MLDPMTGDLPQSVQVDELDASTIAGHQPLFLKASEYAAHGFLSNAQVISDVATRHAENELGCGTVTVGKLLR